MPRYFFHTQNGDCIRDDQGEELKSVDAAREEAVAVLGEILRYRGASFWTTRAFSVIVTDAETVRSEIIEAFGVDASRIVSIPLGVDHERFRPLHRRPVAK